MALITSGCAPCRRARRESSPPESPTAPRRPAASPPPPGSRTVFVSDVCATQMQLPQGGVGGALRGDHMITSLPAPPTSIQHAHTHAVSGYSSCCRWLGSCRRDCHSAATPLLCVCVCVCVCVCAGWMRALITSDFDASRLTATPDKRPRGSSADALSPSLLRHLLVGEGGAAE